MTTLREEFEALMPEPAFRLRWHSVRAAYSVSKPDIGDTNVYTADQVCEAMKAVAERCAVLDEEPRTGHLSPDYCKGFADGQAALRSGECAALMELPRFKYGYVEDDWGIHRALGFIADPAGPCVRFADVVEAIQRAAAIRAHAGGEQT